MYKFGHMSDCHIGAWREPQLRDLNIRAFEHAIDACIKEKVSFIVICGDLFDDNIPDLSSVQRACSKMRAARENGIAIYVIYGSHDYSANLVSMVDVLNSTGLFTKVVDYESSHEDKLKLKFVTDPTSGAKITGISGRKTALETDYFSKLDYDSIKKEQGFKILLFHSAIAELKPEELVYEQSVPISAIPETFNYYAGGHVHKKLEQNVRPLGNVAYPGPLFGADFRDLELTADGEARGFFIVEVDGDTISTKFVLISVCDTEFRIIDAERKTAHQLNQILLDCANTTDVKGKVVLLRIKGTLSTGKPGDIDFSRVRQILLERGAIVVKISRYSLTTQEISRVSVRGESKEEIENKLLAEHISRFKLDAAISDVSVRDKVKEFYVAQSGIRTARKLLNILKTEQKENEGKTAYETRIVQEGREELELRD